MAVRREWQRLSQLWQFPSLIISLGLFAVAGYLFINPAPRATLEQKLAVARNYLKQERPDAALEQLNKILDTEKLAFKAEAPVHLLLAEALEAGQKQLKLSVPENYRRIIQQTNLALAGGALADAAVHRRLGDSHAALGQNEDAIKQYQLAVELDPDHALLLRRRVIELELDNDQPAPAAIALDDYLKDKNLAPAERSWALGQKAKLLVDQHEFPAARRLLADAIKLHPDIIQQAQFNYQLGYCAWKQGDAAEAERCLRLARDQMTPSYPMDGDAAYLLGRICQDRNDPRAAQSFYEAALLSAPESPQAPLALLGRGTCRLALGDINAGMNDLHDLTLAIAGRHQKASLKAEIVAGLGQAADLLVNQENYQNALELMGDEQQSQPAVAASFYSRLGELYEKRAKQLDAAIANASPPDKIRDAQAVRESRTKAGDAYIAYSRALTMVDDKGYGNAMWHGIDLYDSAADLSRVISALELFIAERPQDRLAPDALLRLGTAYQATGQFDKAISALQLNQFRYPKSLAASKSAVPLAEAYVARGPADYAKAEKVLLGVVQDNDLVDPGAEEFHQSLIELAQLYYRTARYEEAIARLEEIVQRYPNDASLPRLTFLIADSYRKSASLLDVRLATAGTGAAETAEMVAAKHERLEKSRTMFDKAVALYAAAPPPASEIDKLDQKLSCFYRADCAYDLGHYDEAIKLYDQAAFSYQDDPAALAAYVQIVNAYCSLGKIDDARTANERAKWILRRMPADAFQNGSFSMPKKYWDDWLKWTSDSGVF